MMTTRIEYDNDINDNNDGAIISYYNESSGKSCVSLQLLIAFSMSCDHNDKEDLVAVNRTEMRFSLTETPSARLAITELNSGASEQENGKEPKQRGRHCIRQRLCQQGLRERSRLTNDSKKFQYVWN